MLPVGRRFLDAGRESGGVDCGLGDRAGKIGSRLVGMPGLEEAGLIPPPEAGRLCGVGVPLQGGLVRADGPGGTGSDPVCAFIFTPGRYAQVKTSFTPGRKFHSSSLFTGRLCG